MGRRGKGRAGEREGEGGIVRGGEGWGGSERGREGRKRGICQIRKSP